MTLRKKIYTIARSVVNKNQELKYYDHRVTTTVSYNGYVLNLTAQIAQGDTQFSRDGSRLMNKGIKLNYEVTSAVLYVGVVQNLRVMIVRTFADNGVTLPAADLIQYPGGIDAVISPYSYNKSRRYKVLYDKIHVLSAGSTGVPAATTIPGYPSSAIRRVFKKLNYPTQYEAGTTGVNDGGLYMFCFSDEAAGANNPVIHFVARHYYTDA